MAAPNYDYDRMKKIALELSSWVLAISASMILGLLSFSGMLAIWPILTFAFAAFIFAIFIEGEIYLQNIRSALEKLTTPKAYENQLIRLYLQEKLKTYDENRDLLLMRKPNSEDERRVREYNQTVLFKDGDIYKIGFRNLKNEYEERNLSPEQSLFLRHYSEQEQYVEIPGHHELVQSILSGFHNDLPPRPQIHYPLFIRAYISQCQYVRRLNCYVHSQAYQKENDADLNSMNQHITHLENEMSEYLFHDTAVTTLQDELAFTINTPGTRKKENYTINFSKMSVNANSALAGITFAKKQKFKMIDNKMTLSSSWDTFKDLEDNNPDLTTISQSTYDFHRNELIKWMVADRPEWEKNLTTHIRYSRLALIVSSFSGLIMGIGTTYLIMEAIASIPWLAAVPLTMFPPIIAPLALLAGIAYGLLIYNSLTDMLLDNPFTKFVNRMRSISWQEMNLKRGLVLGLTVILFATSIFLTICTAGTWLTVFHKTKPLFQWLNIIPNIVLNIVIPILIGISILPFSIQSLTNTLENFETNPIVDKGISALHPRNWRSPVASLPRTWAELSTRVSDSAWQSFVPWVLGLTAEEFSQETSMQKWNPWRLVYRLLFEPLRYFIFIGHLISAGATSDQIEGVPLMYSFWLNFGFECAEDWDWIWGRAHVDNIDTVDLLKERVQNSDDHNHDKNVPMRVLKFLFEPIIRRAAKWDNEYRAPGTEDNVQKRYDKLQGAKPHAPKPEIPGYRKGSNYKLFLFKSSVYESTLSLSDTCCVARV